MTAGIDALFDNNRRWSQRVQAQDPEFFRKLARQQAPEYLWIGCSDSRVPANEIVGLMPGELFVHRNVANLMVHTDLNALSVMQFAVDVLGVKHVMVVGHYGCGGVQAALSERRLGLSDNWLRHVDDVRRRHAELIDRVARGRHHDVLCELNVLEQVTHVCRTTVVEEAWARGQSLSVHGWVYGLANGLVSDLGLSVTGADELAPRYQGAIDRCRERALRA